MNALLQILLIALTLLASAVIIMAIISPFESLGWWAGWSERHLDPDASILPAPDEHITPPRTDATFFLVYFTGIIALGDGAGGRREMALLDNVTRHLPDKAIVIHDVFPYSSSNNPLTGERLFASLWDKIDEERRERKSWINIYSLIIIVRNLLQYAVSADARYGPLNNVGVAREISRSLIRHGYPINSGIPIYLIGYSGGAQIAVGSAPYLKKAFAAPIRVIGWGGVFSDDPGIAYVDQLYQLQGSRDPVPWLGISFFPGRWPIVPHSAWNRAKRNGRIHHATPGPMVHFGRHDYFTHHATLPDGTLYADRVAALTAQFIETSLQQKT